MIFFCFWFTVALFTVKPRDRQVSQVHTQHVVSVDNLCLVYYSLKILIYMFTVMIH